MFAVLLLSLAVQETPAPPGPPVTVVAPKPKKEPQICRPMRDTVTRIGGGRECHTAAQWRRLGDDVLSHDGHELDRMNGNNRTTQNPGAR